MLWMGENFATLNKTYHPSEVIAKIRAVEKKDLREVARLERDDSPYRFFAYLSYFGDTIFFLCTLGNRNYCLKPNKIKASGGKRGEEGSGCAATLFKDGEVYRHYPYRKQLC